VKVSSEERFYDYYADASQSEVTLQRFLSIRELVLRIVEKENGSPGNLEVADIGCGAGTQSMMWAEKGHRLHGLDVNESLLDLARNRAARAGYVIDFRVGSALNLPWPTESMDVCLVPELLEHVAEWKRCLSECSRILKPGGMLFVTTTNKLCPIQQEFNLPLYSWYPTFIKRYFERLAVTTHPQLANFARYPAVNWFTFYGLREVLANHGFRCFDRFDVMDMSRQSVVKLLAVRAIQAVPFLRWLAHVATSGTTVLAVKHFTFGLEAGKS
jgi:2-polyprenyl-3-methyl-5-hydroxy-6-metoxy-1,4-benzoquinol methylase